MEKIRNKERGFTFIEMMVSMVIASFVFAGIYGVYTIQQRSYTVQEQVSEMQQRLRAAAQFMTNEMRMAGYNPPDDYPDPNSYDPNGVCNDAEVKAMEADELTFSFCRLTADSQDPPVYTSELIKTTYSYDAVEDKLYVQHGDSASTKRALAEGIEAIEFLYLDADGSVVTDTAKVRQIKISILARSTFPDAKHTDTIVYEPASVRDGLSTSVWDLNGADVSGTANPPSAAGCDDPYDPCHYHRRLLITTVKLRNMGLE
ncbi:MAG: prepilin-type N-terminal cleavage/methylation domain-containing protein [Candidatus Electrothrix scaldis]|nr:MAG: prepilin-type N-terminal cleavage/methylation domain-containing protein [Candidatus Electrothrix sp. GW3-3]